MIRLLLFFDWLLGFLVFILLFAAIMSWLIAFDVVNLRNNVVRAIWHTLNAITEPILAPIRRYVPTVGNLDLSFIVLFILIQLIRSVLIPDLIDLLR
jgi:YggT family protein